jgi:shikimate kinase
LAVPRTNIALVGFMGAGKSSVGRALATRLGKAFVETDALVELEAGMSVAEVFATHGEAHFRELESSVIRQAVGRVDCVIACGGGAVLREENVTALRGSAVLVYLEVSAQSVLQRVDPRSGVRPLLSGPDRAQKAEELLARRRPVYESVADITVSTDGLALDEVVRLIEERLALL